MASQGEIIRAVLSYSHPAGSIMQNVFTWELQDEDTSDVDMLAGIDTWVDDEWVPAWEVAAADECVLFLLEVDVLNGDGTVKRNVGEEIHADPGLSDSEILPAANSGFFQMDSERAKSLGRKYTPGLGEGAVEDGVIVPAILAQIVLMFAAATLGVDVGITGVLVPGILSRVLESFLEFTGSGYSTDVPAYQRRRKPGVGS